MDEGRGAVYSHAHNLSKSAEMGGRTEKAQSSRPAELALGIYRVADIIHELREIYKQGLDKGASPGWENFQHLYRIKRGMMSIVTGIPSSGKSEFVDALLVNLAVNDGWKCAFFSPENYPISLHIIKIAEKYIGKPYSFPLDRIKMTREDITEAVEFVGSHFTWIYPDDEKEKVNLDTILAKAKLIQETSGLDALVIDPWNELEHDRGGKSETEHVSESLTKIRRFARKHNIHTWIIAHPAKMQKNKAGGYDPPTPYDISGSAHWRNKADFCICVHRANLTENKVEVYVQKAKFKHLGRVGRQGFSYELSSGRYKEEA